MADFTYRRDINRPLEYGEFDDNLLHVEELRDDAASSAQSAAASSSSSQQNAQSAAASEQSAQQNAQSAAQSYGDFNDRYLGPKSSDPATDNDGDPLQEGAMYWNTSAKKPFLYDGSSWVLAALDANGALVADNNLSDLDNTNTARTNLGLGSVRNVPSYSQSESNNKYVQLNNSDSVIEYSGDGGMIVRTEYNNGSFIFQARSAGGAERFTVKHDATEMVGDVSGWRIGPHEIWHAGNDGSGSGLDADKLGGKYAQSFAEVSHDHSISGINGLQSVLNAKRAQTDTAFPRYELNSTTSSATLNLASHQVFRVSATSNRTLSFSNVPGGGRAMTVVIRITGSSGTITWPSGIEWAEGTAPELRDAWTVVTLMRDGLTWRGFVSGGAD